MRNAGSTDEHISADCRLRVLVQLRAELPGRAGRVGRVAVPAASRLPECVRGAARPYRRPVPVRSRQRTNVPAASPVRAGDDGAGDDLADPDGVDDRAGLAGRRPGQARGAAAGLPPGPGRFRRGRRAGPDRDVHQRPGRGRGELRPAVQLRDRRRHVELQRRRLRRHDGHRRGRGRAAGAGGQHPARRAGRPLLRPHHAHRGPVGLRGAVLGRRQRSGQPGRGVRAR